MLTLPFSLLPILISLCLSGEGWLNSVGLKKKKRKRNLLSQNGETQKFYKLQAQLAPAAQMMGSCQSLPVNSDVVWHHSQAIVALFSSPTSNTTGKKKSNFPVVLEKVSQ